MDELRRSGTALAERVATLQHLQEEVDRLNKKLNSEIMLKQQAVNKLAEIMNRYARVRVYVPVISSELLHTGTLCIPSVAIQSRSSTIQSVKH